MPNPNDKDEKKPDEKPGETGNEGDGNKPDADNNKPDVKIEIDTNSAEFSSAVEQAVEARLQRARTDAAAEEAKKQGDFKTLYETESVAHEETKRKLAAAQLSLARERAARKYDLYDKDLKFVSGDDEATILANAKEFASRLAERREADERGETRDSPGTPRGNREGTRGGSKAADDDKKKENVKNTVRSVFGLRSTN